MSASQGSGGEPRSDISRPDSLAAVPALAAPGGTAGEAAAQISQGEAATAQYPEPHIEKWPQSTRLIVLIVGAALCWLPIIGLVYWLAHRAR